MPGLMVYLPLHWQALLRPSTKEAARVAQSNFHTIMRHGTRSHETSHPGRDGRDEPEGLILDRGQGDEE